MEALINYFTLPAESPVAFLTAGRLTSGKKYDQLLCNNLLEYQLCQDFLPEDLHEFSRLALNITERYPLDQAEQVFIYTDGSAEAESSTWAFVVVSCRMQGGKKQFAYHGHVRGSVVLCQDSDHYIGATKHTNISAELSGALHALLFSLSVCKCPVIIYPDLIGVVHIFYKAQSYKDHPAASEALALLSSIARHRNISCVHVKGHSGNPWNELADRCAAAVSTHGGSNSARLHSLRELFHDSSERKFGELQEALGPSCLPHFEEGIMSSFTPTTRPRIERCFIAPIEQHPAAIQSLSIGIVTMNVLTLGLAKKDGQQKHKGLVAPGRPSAIAAMLDHNHPEIPLIVAVQEARAKEGTLRIFYKGGAFLVLSSPCTPIRSHGCQIWLHLSRPFIGNHYLQETDCYAVHSDPYRLLVIVKVAGY